MSFSSVEHISRLPNQPALPSHNLWRIACALALLLCLIPLLVPVLTPQDDRLIMYPYGAALNLLPIAFCLTLARRQRGTARAQWLTLAAHFAMLSAALWAPTFEVWLGCPSRQMGSWLICAFSSAATLFCLLSFGVFSGIAPRNKRLLDALMAFTLCGLNVIAATSTGPTGFSQHHLEIAVLTALFLLCCAEASRRNVTTASQRLFIHVTELYLLTRFLSLFLIDTVNYTWLPKPHELPFNLLFAVPQLAFCLLALHAIRSSASAAPVPRPATVWGNLLQSLILLATVMLALNINAVHPVLCSLVILLAVVCFVLRTHLLYQRMLNEQKGLLLRTGQLEELATQDALTGIGNRRSLEQAAAMLLEDAPDTPTAFLLIDTDRFKWINDTFGHPAGDDLLKAIAEELRSQIAGREGACCARIGGDEFVALFPGLEAAAVLPIAEHLRQRIAEFRIGEVAGRGSVSIGIVASPNVLPLSGFLKLADAALYRAKERGRNAVEIAAEQEVLSYRTAEHAVTRRYRGRTDG